MSANDVMLAASQVFIAFLEENGYRKTPEREAIFEEIYRRDDHYDAETFYIQLNTKDNQISRATVYNTLDLLVTCELVIKHQFGQTQTLYEKAYGKKQHDHIICTNCNKVEEFCDPRIQPIKTMMGELLQYKVSGHSLNLYGLCKKCQQDEKMQRKKNLKKRITKSTKLK